MLENWKIHGNKEKEKKKDKLAGCSRKILFYVPSQEEREKKFSSPLLVCPGLIPTLSSSLLQFPNIAKELDQLGIFRSWQRPCKI
jgi:hypothetical protein